MLPHSLSNPEEHVSDQDRINVLVVDDDPSVRLFLSEALTAHGMEVVCVSDGMEAMDAVARNAFSVGVVDINMPQMTGMETISGLRDSKPEMEFILFTAHPSLRNSMEGIRREVFDCIAKPATPDRIITAVRNADERRRLMTANRALERRLRARKPRHIPVPDEGEDFADRLVGSSDAMRQVRQFIKEVAPSDMTVLIRGETGVGKDIVAHLIHEASEREQGSYLKINAPAIPETLLESELFGHEQGAFTGADRRKPGRLEMATNGTVFLDEIAEISPMVQAKLLHAIEHKQFNRLGGSRTIKISARIIAATNAPIEELISQGRFRADLFYRLNQFHIEIPPLRRRKEDIPPLVGHFLRLYGSKFGNAGLTVSREGMDALLEYHWPGNVRELEAVLSRFALNGDEAKMLRILANQTPFPETRGGLISNSGDAGPDSDSLSLEDNEKRVILAALSRARWNRRKAAEELGISYSSLRRRIDKYHLDDGPIPQEAID